MVKECTIKKNGGETMKEAVRNVNDTGREEKAVSVAEKYAEKRIITTMIAV